MIFERPLLDCNGRFFHVLFLDKIPLLCYDLTYIVEK